MGSCVGCQRLDLEISFDIATLDVLNFDSRRYIERTVSCIWTGYSYRIRFEGVFIDVLLLLLSGAFNTRINNGY